MTSAALLAVIVAVVTVVASLLNAAVAESNAPLRGWRSWNVFGANVNQILMEEVMYAVATTELPVGTSDGGRTTSLQKLGFSDVGLDDGWQACGVAAAAPGMNYHDAAGRPLVNETRFPDMGGMVEFAHSLGLTAGWYANNCICSDNCNATSSPSCVEMIEMDARAFARFGFDSYKLDGCGGELDLWRWNRRLQQLSTHPPVTIENCHWGWQPPALPVNRTEEGCPWTHYRTSGDIRASYASVMANLFSVFPLHEKNLSWPGCWAYPDMLEVGVAFPGYKLSPAEARSHYAAWAIVSSPLILGFDPRDDEKMREVWPLVSNTDILEVQASYVGDSGGRFAWSEGNVSLTDPHLESMHSSVVVPAQLYLYKPIGGRRVAVLLMNADSQEQLLRVTFDDVPGLECGTHRRCHLRDVFRQADVGVIHSNYLVVKVGAHDSFFAILSPAAAAPGLEDQRSK